MLHTELQKLWHLYECVPFTYDALGPAPDDTEVLASGDVTVQKSLVKSGTDDYWNPSMDN